MPPGVLVFGMTNVDTVWKCKNAIQPRGASNYADLSKSVGGVGANLARAVARSDPARTTTFVTALGRDSDGTMARDELAREMELIQSHVEPSDVTGTVRTA